MLLWARFVVVVVLAAQVSLPGKPELLKLGPPTLHWRCVIMKSDVVSRCCAASCCIFGTRALSCSDAGTAYAGRLLPLGVTGCRLMHSHYAVSLC